MVLTIKRICGFQGAARRLQTQKKNVEIESVAEAGKPDAQRETVKKCFRLEVFFTALLTLSPFEIANISGEKASIVMS